MLNCAGEALGRWASKMGLGEVGVLSSVLRCLCGAAGAWPYLSGCSNGESVDGTYWSFSQCSCQHDVLALPSVWH